MTWFRQIHHGIQKVPYCSSWELRHIKYFIFSHVLLLLLMNLPATAQLIIPKEAPGTSTPVEKKQEEESRMLPRQSSETPHGDVNYGIVTANILNMRATPSFSGHVNDTLNEGAQVMVIRVQDEWALVEAPGGKNGWVHSGYLLRGKEYVYAKELMGAKRAHLQGTWRGIWEKRKDDKSDSVLHILQIDSERVLAAGTVDKWSCWQVFSGRTEENQVVLKGVGVFKNQKPASQYALDTLILKLTPQGLRLEGTWSDLEGSSGKVEYRLFSSKEKNDKDIWEFLKGEIERSNGEPEKGNKDVAPLVTATQNTALAGQIERTNTIAATKQTNRPRVSLHNPPVELQGWAIAVIRKIHSFLGAPSGGEHRAKVVFTVRRDGTSIKEPSVDVGNAPARIGFMLADILKEALPLPPIPDSFPVPEIEFEYEFPI